jgi:hypothetical protein
MDEDLYQTPEEEKKKDRKKLIFLFIIIGGVVLYFIWANFLDFGKVTLYGEAPFKAEIFGGETFYCDDSPCELKTETGEHQLIISKENFRQNMIGIDIELWGTTDYSLAFKVNPYLEKTSVIPAEEKEFSYEIMFDEETKNYKLFEKSDKTKNALAYFQEEIKNPKIFGSKSSVIIVRSPTSSLGSDTDLTYFVDLSTKTKKPLPAFNYSSITEYKFSPDGNFFQFKTPESSYWWLMNLSAKEISAPIQTKIESTLKTDWIYGNKIIVISQNLSVNLYDPIQEKFENLGSFPEIQDYPLNIIAGANGSVVYLETKDQKYRIILE